MSRFFVLDRQRARDSVDTARVEAWELCLALLLVVRGVWMLRNDVLHSSPAYALFLSEGSTFWGVVSLVVGGVLLGFVVVDWWVSHQVAPRVENLRAARYGRASAWVVIAVLFAVSTMKFAVATLDSMAWLWWFFGTVYALYNVYRCFSNPQGGAHGC